MVVVVFIALASVLVFPPVLFSLRGWIRLPRNILVWCSQQVPRYRLRTVILQIFLWINPRDGGAHFILGHIRLRQGRRLVAMWHYGEAYLSIIDARHRAAAAYMVARTNAGLQRPAESGRWLVMALDLDRQLLDNARLHPDFDAVSREPEFRRRIGPAFDYGLDTDAP